MPEKQSGAPACHIFKHSKTKKQAILITTDPHNLGEPKVFIARPLKFCELYLSFSRDKHGIPVTEKAVVFRYSGLIGMHHMIVASKRSNQHDQGRFWQMEIRDQSIHQLPLITGINEDLGIIKKWRQWLCFV